MQGREWTPIGRWHNPFIGTFDGQGYIISNLQITKEPSVAGGLFAIIENSKIINVGLENININYIAQRSSMAGGLVVSAENSYISNCFVTGSISVSAVVHSSVGGIISDGTNSTVNDCYSIVNLSASASEPNRTAPETYVGGIMFLNHEDKSIITNCFWSIDTVYRVNGIELANNEKTGVFWSAIRRDLKANDTTTPLTTEEILLLLDSLMQASSDSIPINGSRFHILILITATAIVGARIARPRKEKNHAITRL